MKLCLQINTEKNIKQKATLGTQNDLRPVVTIDKYKGSRIAPTPSGMSPQTHTPINIIIHQTENKDKTSDADFKCFDA